MTVERYGWSQARCDSCAEWESVSSSLETSRVPRGVEGSLVIISAVAIIKARKGPLMRLLCSLRSSLETTSLSSSDKSAEIMVHHPWFGYWLLEVGYIVRWKCSGQSFLQWKEGGGYRREFAWSNFWSPIENTWCCWRNLSLTLLELDRGNPDRWIWSVRLNIAIRSLYRPQWQRSPLWWRLRNTWTLLLASEAWVGVCRNERWCLVRFFVKDRLS